MAISDVKEYAHLSPEDVEAIGVELEAIRQNVVSSLGERDRRYVHNTIRLQRALDASGRAVLMLSSHRPAWVLGVALLASGKIIENMELGHNVMHGQWDWMNDPEIHSTTWEWDIVGTSEHWKATHNHHHHTYTNITTTPTQTSWVWTTTWGMGSFASLETNHGTPRSPETFCGMRCWRWPFNGV